MSATGKLPLSSRNFALLSCFKLRLRGLPIRLPFYRAMASPDFVRSEISAASNSAMALRMWKSSFPPDEFVSILSDSE
jgi:hypothetical protein